MGVTEQSKAVANLVIILSSTPAFQNACDLDSKVNSALVTGRFPKIWLKFGTMTLSKLNERLCFYCFRYRSIYPSMIRPQA